MQSPRPLSGTTVAILLTDDFEQVEMTEPRAALEQAGATTALIAPHSGRVQGMRHDETADRFPVDLTLETADPADFDALLLPGGARNADALRVDPRAQVFVRRFQFAPGAACGRTPARAKTHSVWPGEKP